MNDELIIIRTIHFAATAITIGALIFRIAVEKPALRSAGADTVVRSHTLRVAWIGLGAATVSGVIWFLVQAAAMSGLSFKEMIASNVLSKVVSDTRFGFIAEIRLALAMLLAACLAYDGVEQTLWPALASALGLIGAIAWAGHGGSTMGPAGWLHLLADVLHLLASAAWIGGLVPLGLLLAESRRSAVWGSIAQNVTRRFSTIGILSVGCLLATGVINTWSLVGSLDVLISTEYGRLLILKIMLFAGLVGTATVNRLRLMPILALPAGSEAYLNALRQLERNSLIELALGLAIFAIVGVLGTIHPSFHQG